jgi:hypothetical protein
MDSPTLTSYNYEQFWLEDRQWRELLQSEFTSSVHSPCPSASLEETISTTQSQYQEPVKTKKTRKPRAKSSENDYKATKNIVKNYAKAIANFVLSPISLPYLYAILKDKSNSLDEFLDFVKVAKESIQGIDTFRYFLLAQENDSSELRAFKDTFKAISIIFIKYFSVNWIAHSRLKNKLVYLKYRFRILRRITNPDSFTYLKKPKGFKCN